MEDYSKIVEEKIDNMSFEEYKAKGTANKPKESKFGKFLSFMLLWPIHGIKAFFGIDKDSIMSSGKSGHGGHGGEHHAHNTFAKSIQVDHTPPRQPTWDERIMDQVAIHQIIKDTNGIPNDLEGKGCGPEL